MIPSKFGDERLFFKHEKKNPDFLIKPEFRRRFPKTEKTEFLDTNNQVGNWPEDDVTAKAWVRGGLES